MCAYCSVLCAGDHDCEECLVDIEAHCQAVNVGTCLTQLTGVTQSDSSTESQNLCPCSLACHGKLTVMHRVGLPQRAQACIP
jgi:hypothetical protein